MPVGGWDRKNEHAFKKFTTDDMWEDMDQSCMNRLAQGECIESPERLHLWLGYSLPEHQQEMYETIVRHQNTLMLEPRDHGKSTCVTLVYPVWRILKNKSVRILIVSKSGTQVKKFVGQIKKLLESPKIIARFGDIRGVPWGSVAICVERPEDPDKPEEKDYTVEGIGAGGAVTGGHFDLIICDDILDDENTKTPERMKTIDNWFKGTILQLMEPDTKLVVVGTRKHYRDLYNDLLKDPSFYHLVRRAIIEYPRNYEYTKDEYGVVNGVLLGTGSKHTVLWPEKWDIKTLLLDRMKTGKVIFDREKQNDPTGMEGRILKRDWLNYYTLDPARSGPDVPICPPLSRLDIFGGVDPAVSEDTDDFFAFSTWGFERKMRSQNYRRGFLLDLYHGHIDFPEQVKLIKEKYKRWHHAKILCESNAYQAVLVQQVRSESMLPIFPVISSKNKETRMLGVSPFFEMGLMYIHETAHQAFEQQWVDFPVGEHDDILDACEKCITYVVSEHPFDTLGSADKII